MKTDISFIGYRLTSLIPNRPIDKFYRFIFHKAVSILGEDLEKIAAYFSGPPYT